MALLKARGDGTMLAGTHGKLARNNEIERNRVFRPRFEEPSRRQRIALASHIEFQKGNCCLDWVGLHIIVCYCRSNKRYLNLVKRSVLIRVYDQIPRQWNIWRINFELVVLANLDLRVNAVRLCLGGRSVTQHSSSLSV